MLSRAARPRAHPRSRGDGRPAGHDKQGCWCLPEPCHAQVIAELADAAA
ncbi:DUF4326 domain-containing protein [Streptomyces sp. NPDC048637]